MLDVLQADGPIDHIDGLCRRVNGAIVSNPAPREADFGASGMQRWVDWPRYERAGGTFAIHTKRGCPMQCIYCNYPEVEGRSMHQRDPEDVVDEIERVQRDTGARTFEFTDATFNLPEAHAVGICEAVLRRGLRVNLSAVGVNPLGVTPRLTDLMKRAGFISIVVSADVGNETMLRNLGKGFTMEHVARTAELMKASGIRGTWFFLFGGPGESEATVDQTLAFVVEHLNAPRLLVVAMTGIRILPGTPLAATLVDKGLLPPGQNLTRPLFYMAPGLDEKRVLRKIQRAVKQAPALVHGGEESGSIGERAMYRILHWTGHAPPYIRYLQDFLRLPPMAWLRAHTRGVAHSPSELFIEHTPTA